MEPSSNVLVLSLVVRGKFIHEWQCYVFNPPMVAFYGDALEKHLVCLIVTTN